jgi:thiol-disulfide isomerase/thioredoxin
MRSRKGPLLLILLLAAVPLQAAEEQLTLVNAQEFRSVLNAEAGKVVLVNFWATWCVPCLKEIPVLRDLETEFAARGFKLIPVSLDAAESSETLIKPFMSKWFPGFHSYLSAERDMDDIVSVIDNGWNEVLPTTYLLARDGTMHSRLQGSLTRDEFAAALAPLLDATGE